MLYHMIAFASGVILDWIIGDPMNFPHPIRWIGSLIGKLTDKWLSPYLNNGRDAKKERTKGLFLVLTVIAITLVGTSIIVFGAYLINVYLGIIVEAVLVCYLLAAKSLYVESMKVSMALNNEGLEAGRYAVSMIVGRDTNVLDEKGVIRAAVETVAENTSDGIIAPLLYAFIGGPILGFAYKAINTMDSMVGYHSDKYEDFGHYAAKLDDVVNFLPARISAFFMILASFLLGRNYSGKDAARIFKRDRFNHKSPNSAQTESVCAGALGIMLAGDASYFGKIVKKPFIGDDKREIENADIHRAGLLMFATEVLIFFVVMILGLLIVWLW
ncbi:MAG: cobalamin biosynthesis protein CobD [Lachnospiraceae bacterium]|nr:cobalamin biosynthesis protein CobD [Candidatus Merdinaster equi]